MKYHYLIGLKHLKDPQAFIEYSNNLKDVYSSIGEYNLGKKRKVLIVFDDMITKMISIIKTFTL